MGNFLFPLSSMSDMVNYDRDLLLDKLFRRLHAQNEKILDLRIRLLKTKMQPTMRKHERKSFKKGVENRGDASDVEDAFIERLENRLNNKLYEHEYSRRIRPSLSSSLRQLVTPNRQRRYNSLSERFNSLNLMKINEWQRDHNTCSRHRHYQRGGQYEDNNSNMNFCTLGDDKNHYDVHNLASSDSFRESQYKYNYSKGGGGGGGGGRVEGARGDAKNI